MPLSWWELNGLLVVGHYVEHSWRLCRCLAVEWWSLLLAVDGCFATLAAWLECLQGTVSSKQRDRCKICVASRSSLQLNIFSER